MRAQPASQPSSLPAEFVLAQPGWVVSELGYYATVDGARAVFKAQRMRELDVQHALDKANLKLGADENQLANKAWCARWCLPLGGTGGLILGVIFGVFAASAHH